LAQVGEVVQLKNGFTHFGRNFREPCFQQIKDGITQRRKVTFLPSLGPAFGTPFLATFGT
jgi:hypothetical protein